MSVHLKVIAGLITAIELVSIPLNGCAISRGIKKAKDIPLTPYRLRYATIGIPGGVKVKTEFSYEIRKNIYDDDNAVSINTRIEVYDSIDIQAYFDAEIARIRNENKVVNITKQETETIDGCKALVLHIDHKKHPEHEDTFTEYVGILCKTFCVLFKAWGFLDLFTPGEHLWQAMYRSFRGDHSQPYKLPFGSFILPKEARDRSRILLYFLTKNKEENDDENEDEEYEDDYEFTIEYANNIKEAKKEIPDFKHIMLTTFLGSVTLIRQNKTVRAGSKKGRYFEALVITPEGRFVMAFFQVLDDLKPGLKITMGSNDPKTFEHYRPQMKAILRSITFDEDAAGAAGGEE